VRQTDSCTSIGILQRTFARLYWIGASHRQPASKIGLFPEAGCRVLKPRCAWIGLDELPRREKGKSSALSQGREPEDKPWYKSEKPGHGHFCWGLPGSVTISYNDGLIGWRDSDSVSQSGFVMRSLSMNESPDLQQVDLKALIGHTTAVQAEARGRLPIVRETQCRVRCGCAFAQGSRTKVRLPPEYRAGGILSPPASSADLASPFECAFAQGSRTKVRLLPEYRAGGIRTRDLLNPIQALYQAEPRPVSDLVEFNGTIAKAMAILRSRL
jgi:hypothetical protein